MKKLLLYSSIPLLMVACKSSPTISTKSAATVDTTGLAAFQQFKALNEQKALAMYYGQAAQSVEQPVKTVVYKKAAAPKKTRVVNDDGAMVSESSNAAKAPVKKGWSKAATGATIGTVAGAAAGAVINKKNRVLGGVIGGVAGGVIGYGIGRGIDKKDGRY